MASESSPGTGAPLVRDTEALSESVQIAQQAGIPHVLADVLPGHLQDCVPQTQVTLGASGSIDVERPEGGGAGFAIRIPLEVDYGRG